MNKPFIVSRNELLDAITTAINNSDLDIGIVDLILRQYSSEVSQIAEREAKAQIQSWSNRPPEDIPPFGDEVVEPDVIIENGEVIKE